MYKESFIVIALIFIMLLFVATNTANEQEKYDIEQIKNAVIEDADITCKEYLLRIEEE